MSVLQLRLKLVFQALDISWGQFVFELIIDPRLCHLNGIELSLIDYPESVIGSFEPLMPSVAVLLPQYLRLRNPTVAI